VAKLKLASCMAENAEPFCAAVADHLTEELRIAVEYVNDGLWQERERRFDAGVIQILWLCGLPYVEKPISADWTRSSWRCPCRWVSAIAAVQFIFPT